MHISDEISRFSTHNKSDAKTKAEPVADFNLSIHDVEEITGLINLTLKQIASETATDVQLEQLKEYIVNGFPKSKYKCTELMRTFFNYRESLIIISGIVLKDKRIVILLGLHDDAMAILHRSHMGIIKTKERSGQKCTVI